MYLSEAPKRVLGVRANCFNITRVCVIRSMYYNNVYTLYLGKKQNVDSGLNLGGGLVTCQCYIEKI